MRKSLDLLAETIRLLDCEEKEAENVFVFHDIQFFFHWNISCE